MRASSRQACPSSPRHTWAPRWPLQLLPLLPGPVLCVEGLARVISRDDLPVERALRREQSHSDAGLAARHPSDSSEEGQPTPPRPPTHVPQGGDPPGAAGQSWAGRVLCAQSTSTDPGPSTTRVGMQGPRCSGPAPCPRRVLVPGGWSIAQPCPVRSGLPGPAPPSGGLGVCRAGRRAVGHGSGAAQARTAPRR